MSINEVLGNSKVFIGVSLILLAVGGVGGFKLLKIEEGREPVLIEMDKGLVNVAESAVGSTSPRAVWKADPVKKSTKSTPKIKTKTKAKKKKKTTQ